MENIKLSFIVPVYNVAPYLRKCVDSLLAQDYDDYEIILVDDGSTDSCPSICDEYGQKYDVSMYDVCRKCVRVIHQENGGLSAARNAGLRVAKGEYICFVDSDDYWEENILGTLMDQVEGENLDILRFDYQNVRIKNEGVRELENEREYEVFEPNKYPHQVDTQAGVVDGETYLNTRMGYACYAVMYIVRRNLLICNLSFVIGDLNKEDCLFTEGIHFEDVDWLPRMMLSAKRVDSTPCVAYNYFHRPGSITQVQGDKAKIQKNIEDRLLIIDKYRQYIEQYPDCNWLRNMQSSMVAGVLTNVALELYAERGKYIKQLRDSDVFPLSVADQGRTYVRRAHVINALGPNMYCAIMHWIK